MDEPKDPPFPPSGWGNFERFFNGKFPFAPDGKVTDTSVDEFVKGIFHQVMPNMNDMVPRYYQAETFETHASVLVRVRIPSKEIVKNATVQASSSQVIISGLPDNQKQTIKLPSLVVPDLCKAVYKEGILQMSFRKFRTQETYYDIKVRFT